MNTTNEVDVHDLPIDLQCIKEDLITTDSINQLDIAFSTYKHFNIRKILGTGKKLHSIRIYRDRSKKALQLSGLN
ncbi:MAG: hypothetical protein WBZ36_29395 [Candidatus Nitrosopolaris sp.]